MRKLLVLAFFLLTGISYAQTLRETRIYIPQIDGVGREGDNDYFHNQLDYEVTFQRRKPVKTRLGCDYILRGSIELYKEAEGDASSPVPEKPIPRIRNTSGRREYFSWDVDNSLQFFDSTGKNTLGEDGQPLDSEQEEDNDGRSFFFNLELVDKAGEVIDEQRLIYNVANASINDSLSNIVYALLSRLEDVEIIGKWLFLEASAIWSPRNYSSTELNLQNFGCRVSMDFNFADSVGLSLGAQFVTDTVYEGGIEYSDYMLEVPVALKFLFKPSEKYTLEPCIGLSLNYSLLNAIEPSPFMWFAGLQYGAVVGNAIVVIDQRFSMDFTPSKVGGQEYQRFMLQVAIGFKYGFFPKSSRVKEY